MLSFQHLPLALATRFAALRADRRGVTAIEYGLIAALIAVVITAGVGAFGNSVNTFFNGLAAKLSLG
ncbi:Flp family type IVb pilin [Roseomonas sp. NAR14]|uniref:Flp family type IVb pilin n=1 Tax=Roseomonas acroporae TaxID=2937791 RepID=A0A9X1YC50_9PROT|nr:Flp family type IVb pilin [Roseomonas acroporae]MCK8786275.1 Flp family type IVb pilin [Roseomonas acroporae]